MLLFYELVCQNTNKCGSRLDWDQRIDACHVTTSSVQLEEIYLFTNNFFRRRIINYSSQ